MSNWQPINTAPKNDVVLFWVRPKTEPEARARGIVDTDNRVVLGLGPERLFMGKFQCWSSLETADWWMPVPTPPETSNGK